MLSDRSPMVDEWEEHARIWERDEHARFFAAQAFASLLGLVDLHADAWKDRRILDFGCGTGLLTEKLAPLVREVVAVDTSPAMIGVLRSKQLANVVAFCVDLDDPAVRSKAAWLSDFDLIVASSVCSFLPTYESTLALLARALSPAGHFVQWDWLLSDDENVDDDGFTLDRVAAALDEAGLSSVRVEHAFSVVFEDDESPVLMGAASKP